MRNVVNFLAFQAAWFVVVGGAARGSLWIGPVVVAALVALHLALVPPCERLRQLAYVALAGLLGALLDSLLKAIDATAYPTSYGADSAWPTWLAPLWIAALWTAFATLPRFSLGWLRGRHVLAAVLGAVGGPLSFFAGTRMGAVAVGDSSVLTWTVLAAEYAVVTPLLLALAPADGSAPRSVPTTLQDDLQTG